MKQNKIPIVFRISNEALGQCSQFISQFKDETLTTLVEKSMRRYSRSFGSINTKPIPSGKARINCRVDALTLSIFRNAAEDQGHSDALAIRVAIAYYMNTEKFVPRSDFVPPDVAYTVKVD